MDMVTMQDGLPSENPAIELRGKRKIGRPPVKRTIFASLLLIALSATGSLEARGWGRIGTAKGVGHFCHPGGRAFGFGIRGQLVSGYGVQRFRHPGFGVGPAFHGPRFPYPNLRFGYYAPFYTYGSYFSSADYGISLSSSMHYGDNDSQLYPPGKNTVQPNPKTNCEDSWASERHDSSLNSVIRSTFQRQCENAHPPINPTDQEHGQNQDETP
jgi:hypothetical protein